MLAANYGLGSEICRHPKSAVWRIDEVLDSNGQLMRLLHTRHNTPFTFAAEALFAIVRVKIVFSDVAQLVEQGFRKAQVVSSSLTVGVKTSG